MVNGILCGGDKMGSPNKWAKMELLETKAGPAFRNVKMQRMSPKFAYWHGICIVRGMLFWIPIMWPGLSVACALVVGKLIASVDRGWSSEELKSCLQNPSVDVAVSYTMSVEPRQMSAQASAR